jgi:hypothetical protein
VLRHGCYAKAGFLPIASFLVLPLVPIFSGYPLTNKPKYILWAYQIFSSFTALASILAFTVEIQHGGRLPFIGKVGAEVAGAAFLSLYSFASLAVADKSGEKRLVNVGALGGILYNRVLAVMASGVGMFSLLGSVREKNTLHPQM